MLTMIDEYTR
jgi:putative transposase